MRLVYLSAVWPEPTSSAAGTRVLEILQCFREAGWELHLAATAQQNENSAPLQEMGISCAELHLNDSRFDAYISELQPDVIIFDRFMLEEQFAMRAAEQCPQALRVLDTSDLHFLRRARQRAFHSGAALDLHSEDLLRELAAIHRCDLTLIISAYELALLKDAFRIVPDIVHYCPFMIPAVTTDHKPYAQRQHFMHIGNFLHKPNADAVLWLKKEIWPLIRAQLPEAECHVYGPYATDQQQAWHDPGKGFLLKGRCPDALACLEDYRINLAPLRYGAGLKGKIIDAWRVGTPTVTTAIGAEGMFSLDDLPQSAQEIADQAVAWYQQQDLWQAQQALGYTHAEQFLASEHGPQLLKRIQDVHADLDAHRKRNVIGAMLQHSSMKSTYYMSKWIEEKNKD